MLGHFYPLRKAARIGRVHLTAGLAAAALCGGLLTQAAAADGVTPAPKDTTTTWGGLGWGLGVAADFDIGGGRVAASGAQIVTNNGTSIVRVTDTSPNVGLGFVLEAHYFFTNWDYPAVVYNKMTGQNACSPGNSNQQPYTDPTNCNKVGIGPFIAIEVGGASGTTAVNTNTPITSFAMGVMVGLHHPKLKADGTVDPTDHSSWNFGIGFRVDPTAKVLGDGFYPNLAPPPGETAIRYKTEPRAGVILLSSFSF
jgi:hypothetical protein